MQHFSFDATGAGVLNDASSECVRSGGGMRRKGDRPYTKSGVRSMDMKCRRGSKDFAKDHHLMIGGLQTIVFVSALYCGRRILSHKSHLILF